MIEDLSLENRVDVAETHVFAFPVRLGNFRVEFFENVKLRIDRIAHVQVVMVFPRPAKRLSVFDFLQTLKIDAAFVQKSERGMGEIAADNSHQPHRRGKVASGGGNVNRRSAQRIFNLCQRCLDSIESYGTDN